MKLLKDYDCFILYHQGKANVVVDALSRKSMGSLAGITLENRPLAEDMLKLELEGVQFELGHLEVLSACLRAQSPLINRIKVAQGKDRRLVKLMEVARGDETFVVVVD